MRTRNSHKEVSGSHQPTEVSLKLLLDDKTWAEVHLSIFYCTGKEHLSPELLMQT